MQSRAGQLVRAAFDIDYAINAGLQSVLPEITCEEMAALKAVRYERDRIKEEKNEELKREADRAERAARGR